MPGNCSRVAFAIDHGAVIWPFRWRILGEQRLESGIGVVAPGPDLDLDLIAMPVVL
jgi:hypothetical protein